MSLIVFAAFCILLVSCLILDVSILYALAAGLLLFLLYGRSRGASWRELILVAVSGVKTIRKVLLTFALIGVLTALWRDAGTISIIVCYAARLVRPSVLLVMAFLMSCLVSVLTGTALGTAATMGVICMTIADSMRVSPALIGGAVLAGCFFGDRCSPVSSSALLVAELTGTSIFRNIPRMLRSACVPFVISCSVYLLIGASIGNSGTIPAFDELFRREQILSWVAILPAVILIILSLLKIKSTVAIVVSIITAIPISLFLQKTPVSELLRIMAFGFCASDTEVASLLNGGGIVSMLNVIAIVCLSASYSGLFEKTKILHPLKRWIEQISNRTPPYFAVLCTAVLMGVIACGQTLTIMLTKQLCEDLCPDAERLAVDLEDSAVVVSPLIPWSIACAAPIATLGCDLYCIPFACFLYLLPVWRIVSEVIKMYHRSQLTEKGDKK